MNNQTATPLDRIISRADFAELTGMSRTTLWRLLNSGDLPEVVKINGRILGFRESAYLAWLDKNSSL